MNTLITLSCLLAVVGLSHAGGVGVGGLGGWGGLGWGGWGGYGGYGGLGYGNVIVSPAAVSTANLVKAAPIPVIRTIAAPVIAAPVIKSVGPIGYGLGGLGGLGWGSGLGYGLGGYGGYGKALGLGYGKYI